MIFQFKNINKLGAFGTKTSFENSKWVLIPVPWEATASYGHGTSEGPELIRQASSQLDFFNKENLKSHNAHIHFQESQKFISDLNKQTCMLTKKIHETWEENKKANLQEEEIIKKVNTLCSQMVDWVEAETKKVFDAGKVPILVGGDHSVSEGALKTVGKNLNGDYGILHIDAHHDLRKGYQGFQHSHASVMYNVMQDGNAPKKLVQVGIRDFCKQEYELVKNDPRIICFYDQDTANKMLAGETWASLAKEIISHLPENVYISLDVDGLSWDYAPSTGTPVPGGLSFYQALFLFQEIKKQNKKIYAFDVVETSGKRGFSEWNGNVSARLIYEILSLMI